MRGGGQLPCILAFISITQSSRSCQPSQPAAVLDPGSWLRSGSRWTTSHRRRKPGQSVRVQRQAEGPLEDALRSAQTPTSPAGRAGGATCHWLKLFPATPAPPSPCLACHQSFLLCVLDPAQDSRGSCGLGRTVYTSRVGRQLPLWTRATPSWTLTHPHFPGPTETRLALQPNSRKGRLVRVCTRSWNSRPVATQYSEHNWGRLCNLPCREAGRRRSSQHRRPGCLGTEPDANLATFGWQ